MTTRSTPALALRLAPLLASLAACAITSSTDAGCIHPVAIESTTGRLWSLEVLNLAEHAPEEGSWTSPDLPCKGPRCRSKTPSAPAPVVTVALDRHEGCLAGFRSIPALEGRLAAWPDPVLTPIRVVSALERPPKRVLKPG